MLDDLARKQLDVSLLSHRQPHTTKENTHTHSQKHKENTFMHAHAHTPGTPRCAPDGAFLSQCACMQVPCVRWPVSVVAVVVTHTHTHTHIHTYIHAYIGVHTRILTTVKSCVRAFMSVCTCEKGRESVRHCECMWVCEWGCV